MGSIVSHASQTSIIESENESSNKYDDHSNLVSNEVSNSSLFQIM